MTVKMIVFDPQNQEKAIRLEAPSPGHFNYIETAFIACFPSYANRRFSLVIQEVDDFPKDTLLASKPLSTSQVNYLGEISGDDLVGLISGTRIPNMSSERK